MRIRNKLIVSYGVVLLATAGFGAYSVYQLNNISHIGDNLADHWLVSIRDAGLISHDLSQARLVQADVLMGSNKNSLEQARAAVEKVRANIEALIREMQATADPEEKKYLAQFEKELHEALDTEAKIFALVEAGRMSEAHELYNTAGEKEFSEALQIIQALVEYSDNAANEADKKSNAIFNQALMLTIGFLLAQAALVCAALVMLIRAIAAPINRMTDAMRTLAKGDTRVSVDTTARGDEIGDMAKALQVFKDNAIAKIKMESEHAERQQQAEADKRKSMDALAQRFEASVQGIVQSVAAAATELSVTAQGLTGEVKRSSENTKSATEATVQTSGNVQSVADSLEEMSASVKEISSQIHKSSQAVAVTAQKTQDADREAKALSEAARNVESVLDLIADISSQIGLLALNATIESARAGEAGKGFAVVANEVKNLSVQTEKQLEQIRTVIEEMFKSSAAITQVIRLLNESVQEVSANSTVIASAVEEQSATTNEISRNMQTVATATDHITTRLNDVSGTSQRAADSSAQVLEAANELSRQAEMLDLQVKQFLQEVRNA